MNRIHLQPLHVALAAAALFSAGCTATNTTKTAATTASSATPSTASSTATPTTPTATAPRNDLPARFIVATAAAGVDSTAAIQRQIDACSAVGGGTVHFPPGVYTSGTLQLRSHVQIYVEAGATIFSAKGKAAFPKEALFFGEDLEDISLTGRGLIDGRAEYTWRENDHDDSYILPNQFEMTSAGKSLRRAFPTPDSSGHLIRLIRCQNVQIRDLSFRRSPSWAVHLWGCERVVIDGVDIRSSLKEAVWSDGIDPDGCRDVRISNCVVETGDDALVFYSTNLFGPARPCEDITVTNCRFTSSSSAIKFCDGNQNAVRRVTISNCIINNSNRGIAFMTFDGGYVSDVVIENVVIECTRRDWFWWGDGDPLHFRVARRSEIDTRLSSPKEPPAGSIRNIMIRNVIARGMGTSQIHGNGASLLKNITLDGVALHLMHDPGAPYDRTEHALSVESGENIQLRNVEVFWDKPVSSKWQAALYCSNIHGLLLDHFRGRQAPNDRAFMSVIFMGVTDAWIRNGFAPAGTLGYLHLVGASNHNIQMMNNDLRNSRVPLSAQSDEILQQEVHSSGDLLPAVK